MSYRAAEEAQLLAEEKWIIEALTKIKLQRNSLQIERLHLESLKSRLLQKSSKSTDKPSEENKTSEPSASTQQASFLESSRNRIEFEVPIVSEAFCNEEPLDLAITKSVFNQDCDLENMEEYDDDEDTCDNIFIDINMLMNSNRSAEPDTEPDH